MKNKKKSIKKMKNHGSHVDSYWKDRLNESIRKDSKGKIKVNGF